MRYVVRKSIVRILGGIWWPYGATCAQLKELSAYDVENARDDEGKITRESLDRWVSLHSGDFSSVVDWSASIEDGDETLDFDWEKGEESECAYLDACSRGNIE